MFESNRPLFARRLQEIDLSAGEFERLDVIRLHAVGGNIFGSDENSDDGLALPVDVVTAETAGAESDDYGRSPQGGDREPDRGP